MTHEEALSVKQSIEEALQRYSDITRYAAPITVSIKEETVKKLVVFKTKIYSISISPQSNNFNLSEINSFDDAKKLIDQLDQLSVQTLSRQAINLAFGPNLPKLQFDEIDKEYQQIQNQNATNTSEHIVGNGISFQKFFPIMKSLLDGDVKALLFGDDHENILPSFYMPKECRDAFKEICNWEFDLSAIERVEGYIKEVATESAKALSENNGVDELIDRYLKIRENLLLNQEDANRIIKSKLKVLSDLKETIDQAKAMLKEIKDENKTDHFKDKVEPYVLACSQAIEITRTRYITIANMIRRASEYLTSQEYKDFLSAVILEKGNERQKKYFQICEQIAENGGSFSLINEPSQSFKSGNSLTETFLSSIEEARLYNGKVVSVYDQTVAGTNFYPVRTPKEKECRDYFYNNNDRGYDSKGNKLEVLEQHKRQATWYSGSDGSTYLWIKGVGFINTETETLLTAEEFKNLEARGVKIVITQGLDYLKKEIGFPRMKDGSPYKSVYDFEQSISSLTSFRGKEVIPDTKVIYAILKENGLIPHYFGEQAIRYLDSKFRYHTIEEQERDVSSEEFNEFDYKQEVKDSMLETGSVQGIISEVLDTEKLEEIKVKVKESLAEKIRKAALKGADSLSVKKEDLDIMEEIVTITQIIAKEQGIDIEVEASENIQGNVTAVANYDRNKISFNLKALRNLDGFSIDVTRLEKGDVTYSAMNIIRLIQTMLHEIKHFEQKARIENMGDKTCDLETFKEAVENEIIKTGAGAKYYQRVHDNFLSELNADIYGWEKCVECFKEYFEVDRVPSDVLENREKRLDKLKEKKQPSTNTVIQGNGCLSTFLSEYGHASYSSGKLVAEQVLEIVERLERQMKNVSDNTRYFIEKIKSKCTEIIRTNSVTC